ncbi:MAG TPA: DUF1064 domain-containing protein [Methanospirillum sp.]|uniref:DUF1064 domain-containing protein n=1 Tax=Methanospirillum sp. TaxID=45200 RepID=UPI002D096BF3|nr:DUF1064 domain-containing protein [Methanospirillum sp.]HWQ64827.1 DUF1064 domain-containing protein [Methanospirillum sp.]
MKSESKYHNIKTIVDDITFDSKKEARRYLDLKLLQRAGEVVSYFRQPEFVIINKHRNPWTGKMERENKYRGDFAVKYKGMNHWVIEDVKGGDATKTKDFLLKRKLFIIRYPCLELRLL